MCGRYTHLYTWKQLHRLLNLNAHPPEDSLQNSWNVAPTQAAPVVSLDKDGNRVGSMMQWGFAPAWATNSTQRPINARSETVSTSPLFRGAFKSTRCIVPVSGFYEWKPGMTDKMPKQPYYITLLNDPIMFFAGLWTAPIDEQSASDTQRALPTFTILTTTANEAMQQIHNRMPVMLAGAAVDEWLTNAPLNEEQTARMLAPMHSEELKLTPVSTRVNKPSNNDPKLIDPSEERNSLF